METQRFGAQTCSQENGQQNEEVARLASPIAFSLPPYYNLDIYIYTYYDVISYIISVTALLLLQ